MKFEYNGNLDYMDRVKLVSNEIIEEYPEIGIDEAKMAAILEDVITTKPTNEIKFKRLYNILFATQYNKTIFNHVLVDIKQIYDLGNNTKLMDSIMNEVARYVLGQRVNFPIISEFYLN